MNEGRVWLLLLSVILCSITIHPLIAEDSDEDMDIGDLFKRIDTAYRDMNDYRCTLLSYNENGDEERMVYFFKKPKQIRMELITPHKGAIITYRSDDPFVYISPLSWLRRLVLSFRLDNPMVMSRSGHRVDESDIGSFIEMVLRPAIMNDDASLLDTNPDQPAGEAGIPDSYLIRIDFKDEIKGRPKKFKVWIDKRILLPIRIDSYYPDGRLLESVTFKDLTINSGLSDDIFSLKRR